MGGNEEEGRGRLAGIVKSLFSKNREALQPVPPPRPPPAPAPPGRNLEELNLIKQRVQGASQSILERKPLAGPQTQPPSYPIPEKTLATPLTAISSASPASAASPAPAPAFGVQLKPHEIQESVPPAAGLASQPKLLDPSSHASSSASAAAQPKPSTERPQERKSKLDEIRDSIEESAKRKNPANLKKNIEEVNEHLRYVKRKSALSEKKIEKIVDEKVREELAHMSSSLKEKIKSNPPQAEKEQLESLQRKLLELMDISDRRSELEMEQLGSQMDGLRRQIANIPAIITQREISEISPLKGEVAFLRDELRKHLSQISDPGEREKIADTLGRAEALYKRFEYNPQEDILRSELEEIKSRMGEFAGVLEKTAVSGEELKLQESAERESIKKDVSTIQQSILQLLSSQEDSATRETLEKIGLQLRDMQAGVDAKSAFEFRKLKEDMDGLKKRVQAIPASVEEAETPKLDSIRRGISELRGLVQQVADPKQQVADKKLMNEILTHLSLIEQKQSEDERKLSRLLKLDESSASLVESLRRKLYALSHNVNTAEQAGMETFREELRALQTSVSASISSSRNREEQEMLRGFHDELTRLIGAIEARSTVAFGELKGQLDDVSRKVAGIPSRVGAGERSEFDAIRAEVAGLQKFVSDALAQPKNEEEKILLKGLQSRIEGLLSMSEEKSAQQTEGIKQELAHIRKKISGIPSRVEAGEGQELGSIKDGLGSLRSSLEKELSKPKGVEEREMLAKILSQLDGVVKFVDLRAGSAIDAVKSEIDSVAGQVADIRSEKADIGSIAKDVHNLDATLKRALSSSGRKDKSLIKAISSQIAALSASLGSKTGAAADNMRKELESMRSQLTEAVSAEKPEIDSIKSSLFSLSDLVEKALANPTIRELNSRLDALRNQIGEMLEMAEAKTGADYEQLKQSVNEIKKGLDAIPAELAAEKPEIDSMKSTVESLQKMLGAGGETPDIDGEPDTSIPGVRASPNVLSGLKDEISSIKELLERRNYLKLNETFPGDHGEGIVPSRRKTKPARRKKAIAKKAAKPAGKKAGRIAKRKPKKSPKAKPRVKKPKKSPKAKPRVKTPKKSPEPRQRVKKPAARTAKKSRVKLAPKRSGTRLLKKRLSYKSKPAPSAKRKPILAGKPGFNYKKQRVRSDVDSFIEDIERRRKAIPEIERRLGGEYATGRRRESEPETPREKRRFERGPGTGRKLERESDAETPEEMLRERESEARETLRERKGEALHERELEAKPEEGPGRLHEDYDSYLKAEKLEKVHSDVKRMHQRLKDIRKLYEEEL